VPEFNGLVSKGVNRQIGPFILSPTTSFFPFFHVNFLFRFVHRFSFFEAIKKESKTGFLIAVILFYGED